MLLSKLKKVYSYIISMLFCCLFFIGFFFRLHRMTSIEREEKEKVKKREKKLEDEEILQQATWVKYTIPIKHQVNFTLSLT